jgi:hypothetical protein
MYLPHLVLCPEHTDRTEESPQLLRIPMEIHIWGMLQNTHAHVVPLNDADGAMGLGTSNSTAGILVNPPLMMYFNK